MKELTAQDFKTVKQGAKTLWHIQYPRDYSDVYDLFMFSETEPDTKTLRHLFMQDCGLTEKDWEVEEFVQRHMVYQVYAINLKEKQ